MDFSLHYILKDRRYRKLAYNIISPAINCTQGITLISQFITSPTYIPPTTPKTTPPTTIPTPILPRPAPPVPVVVVASAAATCKPNAVVTTALPFSVVVTTFVAVVFALHPLHVVHGAAVLQGPAVQPGQSVGGHAEVPHHAVQGFERQSLRVDQSDQGPKLEDPKGAGPLGPVVVKVSG
jgi:hypothetical protein